MDTPPQQWATVCASCGEGEPGPGGILCTGCADRIEAVNEALVAAPDPVT